MARFTIEDLFAARLVFAWALHERRIRHGEFNLLMHNLSRRAFFVVGCEGKAQFGTYALARGVAKRQRRHSDESLVVYRCVVCQNYHIGDNSYSQEPAANERYKKDSLDA